MTKRKDWHVIVRGGESLNVEFKRQMPKLERLARSLSAFSNSSGGTLFFGVEDDGRLCGLKNLAGTRDLIEQVCGFHCDPPVELAFHEWEPIRGTKILVVEIPESDDKPVAAVNPHNTKDAWPFFRSDKENLPLGKRSLKTMRRIKSVPLQEGLEELDHYTTRVLNILLKTPRRTAPQLAKSINISAHRIKKMLVDLEQMGWIHSYFNEKRREYSLAVPWTHR